MLQARIVFELDRGSVLSRILSAAAFGAEAEQEQEEGLFEAKAMNEVDAGRDQEQEEQDETQETEEQEEMEEQDEDGNTGEEGSLVNVEEDTCISYEEEDGGLVDASSIVTLSNANASSVVASKPEVLGDGDEDEESVSQEDEQTYSHNEQTVRGRSSPAHGASDEAAGSGPRADKSQSMKWKRRRGELLV